MKQAFPSSFVKGKKCVREGLEGGPLYKDFFTVFVAL